MAYTKMTLWDFLVDIVPGMIAILICILLLPATTVRDLTAIFSFSGVGPALILIIVSYVVGLVIQYISRQVDDLLHNGLTYGSKVDEQLHLRIPDDSRIHSWRYDGFLRFEHPFLKEMSKARGVDEKHGNRTLRRRYLKGSQVFFSDQESNKYDDIIRFDDYQLRELTWSYLMNNGADRASRFRILYVLMRNLYVLFGIMTIVAIFVFISIFVQLYQPTLDGFGLGGLAFTLLISTFVSYSRRKTYQTKLEKSIITDFYVEELANR